MKAANVESSAVQEILPALALVSSPREGAKS